MQESIEKAVSLFLEKTKNKSIKVISHYDSDGITSAAIMTQTLKRLDKKFSVKIVKNLEKETIEQIKKTCNSDVLIFLDLASSSLEELASFNNDIFIIDHHEIASNHGSNTIFINPHLFEEENISASGLTYLFSKALSEKNKDLANLAIIGLVGDMLDREISVLHNKIIEDSDLIVKRGLMLYPSTRPINKTLEFSSLFIPGVTGNSKGVISLLRDLGIKKEGNDYKSLLELNGEEMSKLITAILLRTKKAGEELIGNIYLVKFHNKLEDARELSAMLNACSRMGHSEIALALCLNNKKSKKKAEEIYAEYKQQLVSALNYAEQNKIEGNGYIIINAKNNIKDTIIGTVASIISMSHNYEEGTVITAMSYDNEKIKISTRIAGRNGRNAREILSRAIEDIGGECGGHAFAAGCLIPKEKEFLFIENLVKNLSLEVIKV